ncbi:nucleotidyltransferase family protein [Bergeriella denitrificans]|uniref:Aminoglycoside resistance protein n=1 Tax=Bergeriella denitrificans TaxID=494 RepID=A0A378UI44_BERDE|nr:nucleotidyltransferase domain-containing protein [Bergeriella denitrificans]STZ77044.1 aminoglycoside resistance protein [Bergeriella denitrificans]
MVDLAPEYLAMVQDILQRHFPEEAVWAFGSRVKGGARPFSDLDLVVISQQPLPLRRMALAEEAFSASDLPYRVDLLDWSDLSAEFQEIIRRRYEVIKA